MRIIRDFSLILLLLGCFVSVTASSGKIALAQGGCETITQDHPQSKATYKSAFNDLKIQTLEVCPIATVNGILQYLYYEIDPARSGNFQTCITLKKQLYLAEKSDNAVRLTRTAPHDQVRPQFVYMAIQKRPCGSLDRSEYVWTHGVTEGSFVTIVNRLRELRDKSIIEFLKKHGTPALQHKLETDDIGDLNEEANIAREKNFIWKFESIGVHPSHDSVSPLFALNFQGPVRRWRMVLDIIEGQPRISEFGWFIN